MILCVAFFFFWGGLPFAMIKFITLTHIVQCFLWESQLLEQGLQNILFKPNCCSVLDTRLSFCWEKYRNSRAVLLQALSHQDTGVFLSWDQSAQAELLKQRSHHGLCMDSCWTSQDQRKEISFSLQQQRVHVIMNPIMLLLVLPSTNDWKKWLQTQKAILRLDYLFHRFMCCPVALKDFG